MEIPSDIPAFPELRKLALTDKAFFDEFTTLFEPVSDYNFDSLWSWNTDRGVEIAKHNNNLVVQFIDYTTFKPFYSFLGTEDVNETAIELLNVAKERGLIGVLKLIPEQIANSISADELHVTEDRSQFDYIYSTKEISEYQGRKFNSKRRLANKFESEFPNYKIETTRLTEQNEQVIIFDLLSAWRKSHNREVDDPLLKQEQESILRLLECSNTVGHELLLTVCYVENTPIAFSIDEVQHAGHALSHFCKVDYNYGGATEFFNRETAKLLLKQGILWWNWEQDVNDEQLRDMKLRYRPIKFLRKYCVELK